MKENLLIKSVLSFLSDNLSKSTRFVRVPRGYPSTELFLREVGSVKGILVPHDMKIHCISDVVQK